jgi:hypothetical protein
MANFSLPVYMRIVCFYFPSFWITLLLLQIFVYRSVHTVGAIHESPGHFAGKMTSAKPPKAPLCKGGCHFDTKVAK